MARTPDELMLEAKFHRLITMAIAGVICFIFLTLATCTMHMNSFNPEEAKAKELAIQGEVELKKMNQSAIMERIKVMEKLVIDKKVDPIAARCAIEGWDESTSNVCMAIVTGKLPVIEVTQ